MTTVHIQLDPSGRWAVTLPDRNTHATCETLDDARRIGYLWAAHRQPCEMIMRDAYHRVHHREFIDGSNSHPPRLEKHPHPTA